MTEAQAQDIATKWLFCFASALTSKDPDAISQTFLPEGWFRDVLAFNWDFRSLAGQEKIRQYFSKIGRLSRSKVSELHLDERRYYAPSFTVRVPGYELGVEVIFTFETAVGHGRGCARLLKDGYGEWKAWSVFMTLTDLRGHEEAGHEKGIYGGHTIPWGDVYAQRKADAEKDPYVLIVGGGQTGLQVAARFKQMGIRTLLIEKNTRIGDNWRKRYPTLSLHTVKSHHVLLYQPYPSNWPLFTPRDKIADWLECYAVNQDLVVWTNSSISGRPTYDSSSGKWRVTIDHNGTPAKITPSHIVLATGWLGEPRIPSVVNRTAFHGDVFHGAQYNGGGPCSGKKVVVVGAGNTAIDICQDLHTHRASSITMIQRSSTCVVSGDKLAEHQFELWPLDGTPADVGDFRFAGYPLGLLKKWFQSMTDMMWEEEKELHEKLRKGGVKLNMGREGEGQLLMVYERGGGYWLDKGAADLIESGDIKVKQGVEPTEFTENGLVFSDGSQLPADVVIFATGYKNIREINTKLFGEDVINRTSEAAGFDEEGEMKGIYRPTGHPGLWYAASDFWASRYYSKALVSSPLHIITSMATIC
ncbi:dimethylaniline monooxygenase [Panus rudis PR-1116 ss-1]|nr:dimethylaniline monooxygenase [Panus rudis PR-1116 ss-1]